jgi:hypothetical protein
MPSAASPLTGHYSAATPASSSGWKTHAVAWLLASVMPFHVLTAVYLDVRGPAHFHVAAGEHDHDHDHDGGHGHSHGQDPVARHHHHPGDASVVTVHDDGLLESHVLEEETASGWSGTMLAALLASGASPQPPRMSSAPAPRQEPLLQTRFLGRLERPPRIALV